MGEANPVVLVLLAVLLAFVLAHFVVEWLQRRLIITAGVEFLLIGALLGPPFGGLLLDLGLATGGQVITQDALAHLSPLVALALGWIGLLYGARLDVARLLGGQEGALTLSVLSSLVTFLVLGLGSWLAVGRLGLEAPPEDLALLAAALAVVGTTSSLTVLRVVQRRFAARGPTTELLGDALRLDEVLVLGVFGALLCVFHEDTATIGRSLTATEWFGLSLVLGLVLGGLFRLFLGGEGDADKQLLASAGVVCFASGTAHMLALSPLLVNAVVGVVLVNAGRTRPVGILEVLERSRGPMVILLMLFAGALWTPVPPVVWLLTLGYVLARNAATLLGGWFAAVALGPRQRRDLGLALVGQGELAVALAVNLLLARPDLPGVSWVFHTLLLTALVNELWSARLLRGLLLDCGELRDEAGTPAGTPVGTPAQGA